MKSAHSPNLTATTYVVPHWKPSVPWTSAALGGSAVPEIESGQRRESLRR